MINTIGYDWKEFQGSYVIVPNRCYFVLDKSANIWRLTFTNFEGTSTGNIEFNTELIVPIFELYGDQKKIFFKLEIRKIWNL